MLCLNARLLPNLHPANLSTCESRAMPGLPGRALVSHVLRFVDIKLLQIGEKSGIEANHSAFM